MKLIVGRFERRGWFRMFGSRGFGLTWKPASDSPIFSERYGYTRTFVIGRTRFSVLWG